MKLVLLSGGSGKRLWPLSNDSRSKQFLKVLSDGTNKKVSMVQRVWNQLKKCSFEEDTLIATSSSQVEMIRNQLGDNVPIVTEPERRDTFPAIALAVSYLYSVERCNKNEIIGVLPVDPYVEDGFFYRVKELENILRDSNADIALIGVTPTFPSEKYGYIVPENVSDNKWLKVCSFKEKPNTDIAEKLISNNALWNCGVFAFKLEYILNLLEKKGLPTDYNTLIKCYDMLPKNSFDYEVVERANHIVTLPYDSYWKDLGTWNTLTEEISDNLIGKGKVDSDLDNVHVINELDIPIALIGVNNVVVAASPDGILISDKESSPKVKDYISNFEDRPMYEERRWGWYKVLDYNKYEEEKEVLTKRFCINSNMNLSYHVHYKRKEVWTILKGEGLMVLDNTINLVKPGDVVEIPIGTKHSIKALSDLEIIEIQTGSELIEEDVIRLLVDWDEIEKLCGVEIIL